jgi:hypothetical protein
LPHPDLSVQRSSRPPLCIVAFPAKQPPSHSFTLPPAIAEHSGIFSSAPRKNPILRHIGRR